MNISFTHSLQCPVRCRRVSTPRVSSLQAPLRRSRKGARAAVSFLDQFSRDQLLSAGAAVAVALGGIAGAAWWSNQQQQGPQAPGQRLSPGDSSMAQARRENAVLVLGATGKTGRLLVEELLKAGRHVVAAARDTTALQTTFKDHSPGQLSFESGVDVTNPASFAPSLLQGVQQTIVSVGPSFNRQEGGTGASNTSQQVDAEGVKNVVEALKGAFKQQEKLERRQVVALASDQDFSRWERLDDVIMGGQSESTLKAGADGTAVFEGTLRVEGGGFCGARTRGLKLDLSAYDGLSLRVLGDGQTFKVNLKTADQDDTPESTYQATFDTVEGEWTTVDLPWWQFVPVIRGRTNENAPPINASTITQLGFVLSRFSFNDLPNSNYKAGNFSLQVKGGISAFKAPRPRVVLVSSAAVERNARIGDDEAARKRDIPIVQLNPGGILNYKYEGEQALRASGLPYTVIRPVGLTSDAELGPVALEFAQGDSISGKVLRKEVAQVVAAALSSPAAVGKTLELRRSEASDAGGRAPHLTQLQRQFLPLIDDAHRTRLGLLPLPKAVPPPPPLSKERTQEILADPRVQSAARRSQASSGNGKPADDRSSASNGQGNGQVKASGQNGAAQNGSGKLENVEEAKEWIDDWRNRSKEQVAK